MALPAKGDERLDPGRHAGRHIGLAEIAGVGQHRFGLPSSCGRAFVLVSIGSSSRLSFGPASHRSRQPASCLPRQRLGRCSIARSRRLKPA